MVDIVRESVEEQVGRSFGERVRRGVLHWGLTSGAPFAFAVARGRMVRGVLPGRLKRSLAPRVAPGLWPPLSHLRKMLVLKGCVQPALLPRIDAAAARVLDRLGIDLVPVPESGCCGAVSHHMDKHDAAIAAMKRNIDAWWPHIERGAEAIVVTASGCGVMVNDYGHLLRLDTLYAERAARVSELAKDVSEVIAAEWERVIKLLLASEPVPVGTVRMAFHSPCTLQHGLGLKGGVERILRDLGYTLAPVADAHLCCGSAGVYSILQPELSQKLKANKLAALQAGAPAVIASANIGCITHLQSGTDLPVRHWIELLHDRLGGTH